MSPTRNKKSIYDMVLTSFYDEKQETIKKIILRFLKLKLKKKTEPKKMRFIWRTD